MEEKDKIHRHDECDKLNYDKTNHEHCCCEINHNFSEHNHDEAEITNKELKKLRKKIFISIMIFAIAVVLPLTGIKSNIIQVFLFLISYFIIGWKVIIKAISNIFHGHFLDENFLMTLATLAAFITQEYPEGVMVMWLYQVGEWFQQQAVGKSRKSIADLMNIRPDIANLEKDGQLLEVKPEDVEVGDIILVKAGEKIPLDGEIVDGESFLDTAALTGESTPKKVTIGEEIYSGCINQNGLLRLEVTKKYSDSTVSRILELVEHASEKKAKAENFIAKFAKYYTPIVVLIAALLACLPSLLIDGASFIDYIHRACSFLVISCPCALVISIPLGFFGGIGGASKQGILMKGSNYIEALSKVKTIVMDKTGTLTKGVFKVTEINPVEISKDELLELTALAEIYSEHPIAISIKEACKKELDTTKIIKTEEIPGNGIVAQLSDSKICVGNKKLMNNLKIKFDEVSNKIGTIVYVARDNQYLGYILISDEIKSESKKAIEKLKKENGIKNIVMLTGDNEVVATQVAKELNIDEVYYELLPEDKVTKIEEMIEQKSGNIAFIGDGINDSPVLTRADIGIAMGALGSDAAIEASDIVIMDDNLLKIGTAIRLSKRTMNIVKQNIIFALAVKFIVLALGALGTVNMWQAVFADVGVSLIAIMNSLRAMNVKNKKKN